MLRRSVTHPEVAQVLLSLWDPRRLTAPSEADRPPGAAHSSLAQSQRNVRHNYTLFAARFAPRVALADVGAANTRLIVIVPVAARGGIVAHVPQEGAFGMEARAGADLRQQATEAADMTSTWSVCHSPRQLNPEDDQPAHCTSIRLVS